MPSISIPDSVSFSASLPSVIFSLCRRCCPQCPPPSQEFPLALIISRSRSCVFTPGRGMRYYKKGTSSGQNAMTTTMPNLISLYFHAFEAAATRNRAQPVIITLPTFHCSICGRDKLVNSTIVSAAKWLNASVATTFDAKETFCLSQ